MTPRCFVDADEWLKPVVSLAPQDAHHWVDVLRVRAGDRAVVCDGRGGEAAVEIEVATGDRVLARVLERRRQDSSHLSITLVQAIPKVQKMEWIIQKATELGVGAILPVMTDHGVVKLDAERAEQRVERWRKIAAEAAKQCRTAWVPRIEPVVTFHALMKQRSAVEVMLLGSLEPDAVPMKTCLASLQARRPASVALLIGPEGDFSPAETRAARAAGALPISYGTRILRVETAALYGLSVLAYEWGGVCEAERQA